MGARVDAVLRAYDIRLAPAIFALGILPFLLPPVISALGALHI